MAGSYFSTDTIAAVATSLAGDAGVGIIRLSGPRALETARAVCRGLEDPKPRYLHRIEVTHAATGQVLDDGLGVLFPAGQSFTGEEVVELQLHGGRILLQIVLERLIATGKCRLALPGEFSFRAVREGRLTLSGAEALGQLIGARSMYEIEFARRSLSGARREEFARIANRIRELLAQSELSIDFIDQDIEVISRDGLSGELRALVAAEEELLSAMRTAQRIAKGVQVTLVGAPNAGKSTLFNAILSEERAIVSPEAGTTRDVITEELRLGPYLVRLADTAGLRESGAAIEREGIARAEQLAGDSEALILVIDAGEARELAAEQRLELSDRCARLVALNKCETLEREALNRLRDELGNRFGCPVVEVSARTGSGVTDLLDALQKTLDGRLSVGAGAFLPTEFQLQMLLKSREALGEACELVEKVGLSQPELVSATLTAAVRALSDLVGETTPDTVLAQIFSEFCIGK